MLKSASDEAFGEALTTERYLSTVDYGNQMNFDNGNGQHSVPQMKTSPLQTLVQNGSPPPRVSSVRCNISPNPLAHRAQIAPLPPRQPSSQSVFYSGGKSHRSPRRVSPLSTLAHHDFLSPNHRAKLVHLYNRS